jgi:hypothetical protein
LIATLGTSSVVRAESESLTLIREGVSLRRKGNDEGALQSFQRAYDIDHSPRALAQMGLAEQALGRWVPAYEHLTQAMTATSDPWIKTNGAALRASSVEVGRHVGKLDILGGSPGAEVKVDGVQHGNLPLAGPLVLPVGSVVVTLGGEGFVSVQRVASIRSQELTRESFEPLVPSLQAAPVQHGATAAITPAADQNSRPVEIARAESPRGGNAEPEERSPGWTRAKWVAWGTAVAAAGVGVLGLTQQNSAANQFNGSCYYDDTGMIRNKSNAPLSPQQCGSLANQQDSWYAAEIGGFVAAGTLAAAGLVLFLLEPPPARSTGAALSCAPLINGRVQASLGCTWRF